MSDMVLELDPALEQIIAFGEQFSASHVELAMHAALPVGLTPELLHLLRINFVKSVPSIAEADLLLSPLCREVYGEWYEFNPGVRENLLREMRTDPRFGTKRVEEIARFVFEYTRRLLTDTTWRSPNLHTMLVAQRWSALAYAAPELAAETLVAELNTALRSGNAYQAVPIARLASALAEPLMGEDRALVYAISVDKLLSGDRKTALSLLETLEFDGQMQPVGQSRLLTAAELMTLIPAETTLQVIPVATTQVVHDEELKSETLPETESATRTDVELEESETQTATPPSTPEPLPTGLKQIRNLTGHTQTVNRLAWSPDNKTLATASYDSTVRLWNMTVKKPPLVLSGPTSWVSSVSWSPDGRTLAAGSGDSKIWLWDTKTGEIIKSFKAHTRTIYDVAWSPDGKLLASGADDMSVALWDTRTFKLLTMLQGHSGAVHCVAWSHNGKDLASCSEDGTVHIWETQSGKLKRILEGHTGAVYDLAWSPDGRILASASQDMTIRLWGLQSGILQGHTSTVNSLSFSNDGRFLASKSQDNTVRVWRCDTWETVEIISEPASLYWTAGLAFHPHRPVLATLGDENLSIRVWKYNGDALLPTGAAAEQFIRYTSAKIVLVGDSGVGKTALANALLGNPVQDTISTHVHHVHRFDSRENVQGNGVREIHEVYLWDMAGQASYHLIHQLRLNQVVVALVVFDIKSDVDPFAKVRFWASALRHAQRLEGGDWSLKIFLVAGRTDRGGVGVSRQRIKREMQRLKFDRYFETSAIQGWGIRELEAAIHNAINWKVLPKVSSTTLFQNIKDFLTHIRESGKLLHTVEQLYDTFLETPEAPDETPDLRAQFETCIGLVESQALIRRFSFGDLVLLQPEILDAYASAMIANAKDEADSDGSIVEEDVINVRFKIPEEERLPDPKDEQLLLIATIEDLIRHEIALRDEDANGVSILVFPSQSARQSPDQPDPDSRTVIFRFEGAVINIYSTLVVRLWNSQLFSRKEVYQNATFFYDADNPASRIYLRQLEEDVAELFVYFDEATTDKTRSYVEEYVSAHLLRRASPGTFRRTRLFVCEKCETPVTELQVERRRKLGYDWIQCNVCNNRVELKVEAPASASQSLLRQAMITRLDKEADTQRERQRAISVIQGKRLTGDYDIFFCHNGADKAAVKSIGEQLQGYGLLPWLDEWELPPGQPWQPLVEKQLEQSKLMAFFVGANGTGTWQEQELYIFINLKRPVILVFLPDAPPNVRFPGFMKTATWVDFRKTDSDAIEQLVWGITGQHPRQKKQ